MGAPSAFVGRAPELSVALDALDGAVEGRTGLMLVAGEPGIGKTRLLEEAERLAGTRAVPAVWGRASNDEGAPAFWPWRQVIRSWVANTDPARVRQLVGHAAPDLARIAPELATVTNVEPPASAELDAEHRFALFEAVSLFLARAAADNGLVVVLDDLHWADTASMLLLAHLVRQVREARLLLVGAFRPIDMAQAGDRSEVVAALVGHPATTRIDLAGLPLEEVGEQLAMVIGQAPSSDLVARVATRTAGNPLFVQEVGRLLAAGTEGVPPAVRTAIGQRLTALDTGGRQLLATAAVAGSDIDPVLLGELTGLGIDAVMGHLDGALAIGLVVRARASIGYRFAHELVRETCMLDAPTSEQRRIHLAIAERLESSDGDLRLPEIAHHRIAALPLGDREGAADAASRAAAQAMAQLAYEDAARLYGSALDASSAAGTGAARRARLLVARAKANHLADNVERAMADCEEAAILGQQSGDATTLALAALALDDVTLPEWMVKVDGWSQDALGLLGERDSPLRARLLAHRAVKQLMVNDLDLADTSSLEALAMAERLDDPSALAAALRARQITRSSADGSQERLALAARMVELGNRGNDADAVMWGHLWRFDACVQLGWIDDAEAEVARLGQLVARMRRPAARWHLLRSQTAMHLARGRFAETAASAREAVALAQMAHNEGIAKGPLLQLSMLTGDESPVDDLEELLRASGWAVTIYPILARWHLAFGRMSEAAALYERGAASIGSLPLFSHLVMVANLGAVAAALGDGAGAQAAYERLLADAEYHVTGGAGCITTFGSTHHFLGLSAVGFGDLDRAVGHLRTAVSVNTASGLPPAAAESSCCLAEILVAREDRDEAVQAAGDAVVMADRLGMRLVRERAEAVMAKLRASDASRHPLSRREHQIASLVAEGLTNRLIAERLHIAERTAENHVQHILTKLGFNTRSQIAAWFTANSTC